MSDSGPEPDNGELVRSSKRDPKDHFNSSYMLDSKEDRDDGDSYEPNNNRRSGDSKLPSTAPEYSNDNEDFTSVNNTGFNKEVDFTIREYIDMGFGSEEQFWGESSIIALLEDVRDEKTYKEYVASKLGVSVREIIMEVGKMKTREQVHAEKEKRENGVKVVKMKKLTDLQKKIILSEKNEHSLSDYEKLRLENMREQQELLIKLNFEEEKDKLSNKPRPHIHKHTDYGVREKSSRIEARAEKAKKEKLSRSCKRTRVSSHIETRRVEKAKKERLARSIKRTKEKKRRSCLSKLPSAPEYSSDTDSDENLSSRLKRRRAEKAKGKSRRSDLSKLPSSPEYSSETDSDENLSSCIKRRGAEKAKGKKRRSDLSKLSSSPEYSSDSDDLTSVNIMDCEEIPEQSSLIKLPKTKKVQYRAWCQFIFFSQQKSRVGVDDGQEDVFCSSWNPYTANRSQVGAYLKLLKIKFQYSDYQLTFHLGAISEYLLWLDNCLVEDLVALCQLDMERVPSRLVLKMANYKNYDAGSGNFGVRDWQGFVDFCYHTAAVDPFLAEPIHLANFIVGLLLNKDHSRPERERYLRPHRDFYTKNTLECIKMLKGNLKHYHLGGDEAIMNSDSIQILLEAARSLDSREEPLSSDLAARLRPACWYTEYRARQHSKPFWRRGLVRRVLADVRDRVISLAAAAWQLGVPPYMIRAAISREGKNEEVDLTIGQYVDRGFGSEEQFWGENSNLALFEDVRNRKIDFDTAAFKLGVSAKKLLSTVGEIKTREQLHAEKEEKLNNGPPKAKPISDLQKEIIKAEQNEENLSEYEKLRLKNMRERQELLITLNFEEDQEYLKIRSVLKINDYGVREKSSRIKRKAEKADIKSQVGGSNSLIPRQTPEWVGVWTPLHSTKASLKEGGAQLTHDDLTQILPVPHVNMELTEVLAEGQSFHRANRFLERLKGELVDWIDISETRDVSPAWRSFEQVESSSKVCEAEILSVATWEDLVCYGDQSGGVGVRLGGRCLALQPHSQAVSRVVFVGTEDRFGLSLVSASLDGTVRETDLVTEQVTLERDLAGGNKEEVRWLEPGDSNSWLVNLGGREVRQVDRREKEVRVVVELAQEEGEGSNIGRHPTQSHMISLCQGNMVCLYDLRRPKNALMQFKLSDRRPDQASSFVGSNWSRVSGKYLLGCQPKSSVVWDLLEIGGSNTPPLEWPGARGNPGDGGGACYSRFYGASWCPWAEEVFLAATYRKFQLQTQTVVAIDVTSGCVLADLAGDLCHSSYVIECHKNRAEVVVANSAGPGYLASFKVFSDPTK